MTSRLNPYFVFQGNAREAMDFYRDVFGGDLMLRTFGEFGMTDPNYENKIMHAKLETPSGYTLMASDLGPDMTSTIGNNVVCSLSGDDSPELHRYWERLSADGKVLMPMDKQEWGDEYGSCVDRFNVQWVVDIYQPKAGGPGS